MQPVSAIDLLINHFDESLGLQRQVRWPRLLIYSGLFIVILLLAWIAIAKVDRVVHTQGRVIPSGKQQLIQHLEGGIVSQVLVHEGDVVKKGQSLIAISDLQAMSSQGEKRASLEGLAARIARLKAEANGASIFSPADKSDVSTEVQQQKQAFDARLLRLKNSLEVIDEQLKQKQQEVVGQVARRNSLAAELDIAQQQLSLVSNMMEKKAASQSEFLEARAQVERIQTQMRDAETSIPRLQSAAMELKAKLAETRSQFSSEARTTLADAVVEQHRIQQQISSDDDKVRRTVISAPLAGTVNKLMFNTVGGVVKPGETLMELTPTDEALSIETRVQPSERGALRVGEPVVVKVAAFDYTVFGTLKGKVVEISADSLLDEHGDHYFRVGIEVNLQSLRSFGQPITPGMTVTADAITGQRTILQFILSPIRGLTTTAFRDQK